MRSINVLLNKQSPISERTIEALMPAEEMPYVRKKIQTPYYITWNPRRNQIKRAKILKGFCKWKKIAQTRNRTGVSTMATSNYTTKPFALFFTKSLFTASYSMVILTTEYQNISCWDSHLWKRFKLLI